MLHLRSIRPASLLLILFLLLNGCTRLIVVRTFDGAVDDSHVDMINSSDGTRANDLRSDQNPLTDASTTKDYQPHDDLNRDGAIKDNSGSATGHRSWRLKITSIYDGSTLPSLMIAEIEFKINGSFKSNSMTGTSSGTVAGGYTATLITFAGCFDATRAFDGNTGSPVWGSINQFRSIFPYNHMFSGDWVAVDFGLQVNIEGYRYMGAGTVVTCPDAGWLEYSDDNTNWTKVVGSDIDNRCTTQTIGTWIEHTF